MLSPSRITLENNEKFLPQPDRENAFARPSGGDEVRQINTAIHYIKMIKFTKLTKLPHKIPPHALKSPLRDRL